MESFGVLRAGLHRRTPRRRSTSPRCRNVVETIRHRHQRIAAQRRLGRRGRSGRRHVGRVGRGRCSVTRLIAPTADCEYEGERKNEQNCSLRELMRSFFLLNRYGPVPRDVAESLHFKEECASRHHDDTSNGTPSPISLIIPSAPSLPYPVTWILESQSEHVKSMTFGPVVPNVITMSSLTPV